MAALLSLVGIGLLLLYSTFFVPITSIPVERFQKQSLQDYMTARDELLKKDTINRTGQSVVLTDLEKDANTVLMAWKKKELDLAYKTEQFIGAERFIIAKPKIENSTVFRILQKMPKGAVLHLHDMSIASFKWLINNITTTRICYMCYNTNSKLIQFKISINKPNSTTDCEWLACTLARKRASSPAEFDAQLLNNLTMTDPSKTYANQKENWAKFDSIFSTLSGLLSYDTTFSNYWQKSLEELHADNIQYTEIRALLFPLHNIYGKTFNDPEYALGIYKDLTERFVDAHEGDFFGARFIYTQIRSLDKATTDKNVRKAMYLRKKYPDLVAGFDLVAHEDPGYTLLHYINQLLIPQAAGVDLPYYFHAGETNWEGAPVDYNLVDALLLKTRRIGHGFALTKHQDLMNEAKSKGVAVEVCPISNQVLGLVSDLRNHPASIFLTQNIPMTVSPDDPPIFGTTGVSYDFYELFMSMTRFDDDLRLLKQLAMDSIKYSSLESDKKEKLFAMWKKKWDIFIKLIVKDFRLPA